MSRSTARRSVAIGTVIGLAGVALVGPASAGVPASISRIAAAPFTAAETSETPVTLEATYKLDGEKVTPEHVVGRTGLLETTYLVRNTTTQPTEPAAALLGAGHRRRAAPATLQVAKVTPTGSKTLSNGLAAATETSAGTTRLTERVTKIDESVLKLRDGATQLLDGLIQLAAGAGDLNEGLAGKAAPGAQKLSAGLGTAREGGDKLDDGLGQLLAGGTQLSDGLTTANAGGKQLSGGLGELLAGGGRFVAGLDTAAAGGGALAEGLRSTSGQPDLAGGTASVAAGLEAVRKGVAGLTSVDGLPKAQAGL